MATGRIARFAFRPSGATALVSAVARPLFPAFTSPPVVGNVIPVNLSLVANALAQRLQQIDPANAQYYVQGLAAFQDKWGKATAEWQRQAALRDKAVVPHHKSWAYLANWLGLVEVAALEPKPGVPPSADVVLVLPAFLRRQ